MRPINLLFHTGNIRSVSETFMNACTKAECSSSRITTKPSEEKTLRAFVRFLFDIDQFSLADSFYYTYTIPRISKEFDLLRFGTEFHLNIELKVKADPEKIYQQLHQNQYYLQMLKLPVHSFTYIEEENRLYVLKEQSVIPCGKSELTHLLAAQKLDDDFRIDEAFLPGNYLISPFRNPDRFLEGQYFLTSHQQTIQKEILRRETLFFCLMGGYGTGKTLVLYDLAKKLLPQKQVCIVHASRINPAQEYLNTCGMNIIPSRKLLSWLENHTPDFLLIDEAHLYPSSHLNELLRKLKKKRIHTVFSMDSSFLSQMPDLSAVLVMQKILGLSDLKTLKLTSRIRTSAQISSFLTTLFHTGKRNPGMVYSDIHVCHTDNLNDAASRLFWLQKKGYVFINYPPAAGKYTLYNALLPVSDLHARSVIGLEFEKIAVLIDSSFYYEKGILHSRRENLPYAKVQMLYQQLTRASQSLYLVVMDNPPVFEKIISILSASISD